MQINLSLCHDLAPSYRQIFASPNVTLITRQSRKTYPILIINYDINPHSTTLWSQYEINKKKILFSSVRSCQSRKCSKLLWIADGFMHIARSPAASRLARRARNFNAPRAPPKKIQPRKIWRDPTRKNWRGALRVLSLRLYANPSCASPFFPGWGVGMQLKSRACVWGRD